MTTQSSESKPELVHIQVFTCMGFSETRDMAILRTAISRLFSEQEEAAEIPGRAMSLLHIYRDMAEMQIDGMPTPARSRAFIGYMLLKAEAYRQGGWLSNWQEILDEAEEQAHYVGVSGEFQQSLDLLWRFAMLLILHQVTSSVAGEGLHEGESGTPVRFDLPREIESLEDQDLMGAVQTALYEAEIDDPDEYLVRHGLM